MVTDCPSLAVSISTSQSLDIYSKMANSYGANKLVKCTLGDATIDGFQIYSYFITTKLWTDADHTWKGNCIL